MKKNTAFPFGWCFLFILLISTSFGCAPKTRGLSDATADAYSGQPAKQSHEQVNKRVLDYLAASEDNDARGQDVLIQTAKTALGTPYVRGGTSTDGFDCSGFVQWTFNQVGVKLPRTAREQSRVGLAIRNVNDMEVGDIVAFHHPKRGYHTGIYVGEGKFIHSPRKRTTVRINALDDPYFSKTFLGARRIGVSSPEDIAAAEKMLADYREQESRRSVKSTTSKRGKSKQRAVASREPKQTKSVNKSGSRSSTAKSSQESTKQGKQAAKPVKTSKSQDKKSVSRDSKGSSKSPAAQASKQKAAPAKSSAKKSSATKPAAKDKAKTGRAKSTAKNKAKAGNSKSTAKAKATSAKKSSGKAQSNS